MIQQMNLFNTTPEKSGYRLDYMEIYNWGTFDKEVYRISPQGNNSLLTGANASGKSTLVDALLTLLVPLKRNRFYNQSSGVEKKGARTEDSYFFGYYGTQQEEGSTGTTTMKLRGKESRSVLLASFRNADGKVVTLFQVRYFSGQLKVVYGTARVGLEVKTDFAQFDARGEWRKRLDKHYNANSIKKVIDFHNGPSDYGTQICLLFGMRSQNALSLFNQIVGVKVLDDLDSFIRNNMLDEQPAENKYIELHNNFQNLMEAKINIDKAKDQIKLLNPINNVAKQLLDIEQEITRLEQKRDRAAYWFAERIVTLSEAQKKANQAELQKLKKKLTDLDTQAEELQEQSVKLSVAIENDEVSKQISDLANRIQELSKEREKRTVKANDYNDIAIGLNLLHNPSRDDFEKNRSKAEEEHSSKQQVLNELSEDLRKVKNIEDEIKKDIEEDIKRIAELERNKNNISGRVSEIRDEILKHVGATPEEIPFIGELIRIKDTEHEWEPSIERILHNFALRLIVPEKYYRKVNEYVNSHNLNGRIVYQRYRDFTSLKEMEEWETEENHLLQKIEFKPNNQYVEWVENEIYHRYNYACVNSLDEFNSYKEKAVTKEGLIKSVENKHEKDDRKEIRSKDNYVLGWENKDKIAFLRNKVLKLHEQQKSNQAQMSKLEKRQSETHARIEKLNDLLKRFEEYETIDWMSCAQTIQEHEERKKKLEATDNKAKALREELEAVKKKSKKTEADVNQTNILIHDISKEQDTLTANLQANLASLSTMGNVNLYDFELQNPELLSVPLKLLEAKRANFQAAINHNNARMRNLKPI